ncbi:hypothetical protein DITRI_Ditri19aG0109000 [Diplodiscus trichospermus]
MKLNKGKLLLRPMLSDKNYDFVTASGKEEFTTKLLNLRLGGQRKNSSRINLQCTTPVLLPLKAEALRYGKAVHCSDYRSTKIGLKKIKGGN